MYFFNLTISARAGPDSELEEPDTFGDRGAYLYVEKNKKLPGGREAWYFSTKSTIVNLALSKWYYYL